MFANIWTPKSRPSAHTRVSYLCWKPTETVLSEYPRSFSISRLRFAHRCYRRLRQTSLRVLKREVSPSRSEIRSEVGLWAGHFGFCRNKSLVQVPLLEHHILPHDQPV